ncbi:MAG: tautomerase family protein [Nevskiales bacterium]
MPVYTLACRKALPDTSRKRIADAITDIHCETTGAPSEFVNVVFMDGHRVKGGKQIAVNGNVRSGGNRNEELTDRLRDKLHAGIAAAAGLAEPSVAVTLIGFPASWAMEGGEILPEPGAEDAWLKRKTD